MTDEFFKVVFEIDRVVKEDTLFDVRGKIILDDSEDDDDRQIGTIVAHYVASVDDKEELIEIADAESAELLSMLETFCATSVASEECDCVYVDDEMLVYNVLWVTSIQIDEPYRGRQYSYRAMREVIDLLGQSQNTLVLVRPAPIDPVTGDRDVAIQKLRTHWEKFGFSRAADSAIYYYASTFNWPTESWMWRAQGFEVDS